LHIQPESLYTYEGVKLAHIINPSYLIKPSEAALSGAKLLCSIEQLKTGSEGAIMIIQDLQIKYNTYSKQLGEIATTFKSVQLDANKSEEVDLPKVIKHENAHNDFETYYRSIIDIQFSSRNLVTLATEINKEKDLISNRADDIISSFFGRIKVIVQKILTKVEQVIKRLKGIAGAFGRSVTELLSGFEDILKKRSDEIINTFSSISDHFVQFLMTLTDHSS
jgi:hypothetical protein